MKTFISNKSFIVSHILFLLTILFIVLFPDNKETTSKIPFLGIILLFELIGMIRAVFKRNSTALDLLCILWIFFMIWEFFVTKLNCLHPVLFPAPENVFESMWNQRMIHLKNIYESLKLLGTALSCGLTLAIFCGLICGILKRLGKIAYSIAVVLTPIPVIVYAPYMVALMPSFHSASLMIIIVGVFFPNFLNIILRTNNIESSIIDYADVMKITGIKRVIYIMLPYMLPGILSGFKVTLTTSIMLLLYAEMMGATCGLGYYIVNYNTYGNYTNVISGIFVIAIVVTVLNQISELIMKKVANPVF